MTFRVRHLCGGKMYHETYPGIANVKPSMSFLWRMVVLLDWGHSSVGRVLV